MYTFPSILPIIAMWSRDMREKTLNKLKKKLRAGSVYRRQDLSGFSSAVDRHLKELVNEGYLTKLNNGLYLRPKNSVFGTLPPDENKLLEAFLKTPEFLVYSPSSFNSLGLGTTQLYNTSMVLNQKRHGELKLGNRNFYFFRRPNVPKKLTKEVLLVELLNNLKNLAEDPDLVLSNLEQKLPDYDKGNLAKVSKKYGTYSTQKILKESFQNAA